VNLRLRPIPIWSKQQEFRQSKAWIRGFFAGRGAGKTKIGAIDILRRSRAGDPCMAISPDSNVIRDTTLPTFIETARATGQYVRDVVSPVPKVWFYCEDGGLADLIFKSAETPSTLLPRWLALRKLKRFGNISLSMVSIFPIAMSSAVWQHSAMK
jgi:hypothetical protein